MGYLRWSVIGCLVAGGLQACDNASTEPSSPLTGTLSVMATTTGTDLDADGYLMSVDRKTSQRIGANTTVNLTGVKAGAHMIWLDGIALNCWTAGPNPLAVTVARGSVRAAQIGVVCTTPNTMLISTLGTGSNMPDSVTANLTTRQRVCDGMLCLTLPVVQRKPIAVNTTVQLPISINPTEVTLTVPSNCSSSDQSPSQNPFAFGGVARWSFVITCH